MTRLRGVFTALVTPFRESGSVDWARLEKLVEWQLEQGVDGLVPCGTTGEAATMSIEERAEVIGRVVRLAGERCTVIAGAGSNDTAVAVLHQKRAADAGAVCTLVATPYYNKPTHQGLLLHYDALLAAADIPIVLYNVPGRTACDMRPDTVIALAQRDGIIGIKEATADLDRVAAIRAATGADFSILSGDDATACPFVWLGGDGVISVASNVVPRAFTSMIHAALRGEVESARAEHSALRPLFSALFWEANPIPVKAALAMMGWVEENYRLPLCPMGQRRTELEGLLRSQGWL
jgi:4-hydroxy-tetrahydrodipicolinate synthase